MIFKALTPDLRGKYLKDVTKCPFCGSGNFMGGGTHLCLKGGKNNACTSYEAKETFFCDDCGQQWQDVYKYARVTSVEQKCSLCNKPVTPGQEYQRDDPEGETIVHTDCIPPES